MIKDDIGAKNFAEQTGSGAVTVVWSFLSEGVFVNL